jgi:tripartite-type tricarboxylate transporter receptor subunit TctC
MLAVIAPERLSAMPDVPTMPEVGFKDMRTGTWIGVFAPKGTPAPIVKRLFDVATKTMSHPEVVKRLDVAGTRPVVSRSPEEFRSFVKSETDAYAVVIKAAGITAD